MCRVFGILGSSEVLGAFFFFFVWGGEGGGGGVRGVWGFAVLIFVGVGVSKLGSEWRHFLTPKP